jgi:cytoskeletal protein CcmA (bactofilin family)
MIRMGRGSTREQSNDTQNYQEQQATNSNNFYQYASETQPAPPSYSAVSDSESMARDIKEGRLSGYVGNGTVLTGETSFQAMLRIDGHLTGKVTSESGTLIIGSSGRVDANIAVASAIVSGTINGDMVASEKLELTRTARVVGNIQTPRLVIEEGAVFEGGCTMLKAKEALDKRKAKTEYPSYETSVAPEETSTEFAEAETEDEAEAVVS